MNACSAPAFVVARQVAVAAALLAAVVQGCAAKADAPAEMASESAAPVAAAPVVAAPAAQAPAGEDSKVLGGLVAVVDGDPLTLRDLREYQKTARVFLRPELRDNFEALLQGMIERRLLLGEFEKNGVHINDQMVEHYINGILQQEGQTREQVEKALASAGLKWSDYFDRMREEVQRLALVDMLIRSRVNVTPEEVERAWKSDPAFLQSERLELADIFLPLPADAEAAAAVRAQATEVVREAKRNFADAARKYSQGITAADEGRLGEFERGTMAEYFERAAKGLDAGDVSQPVEGGGGLHVVKVLKIHSKGRRPLEEVSQQIHDKLYDARLEERYQKWVNDDLRKEHRVEVLLDDLALVAGS